MENHLNIDIIIKQLKDILIVQGEKMENQDLLLLVKYVEKKELQDTKNTYT
jgi:hypothetical protein